MASNLKRSKRTIGRRISSLESRTRRLQKLPTRTRLGPRAVVGSSIAQGSVSSSELSPAVTGSITSAETAATNAETAATNAQTTADDAVTAADDAQTAADTAQATADAAQSAASTAQSAATTAATAASGAQATANGKNKIFYAPGAPSAVSTGDLWFDSDNDYKLSRWDGSNWVDFGLGSAAFSYIDAGKITAGSITSIEFAGYAGNFAVDGNGNVKQNNVLASGVGGTAQGIQILANGASQGALTATNGSIYIFAADDGLRGATSNGGIRIGSVASHLKITKGTSPSSVFVQPSTGTFNNTTKAYTFSENHNLELYCNPGYFVGCNQDFVLRDATPLDGDGIDGSGNDLFADNPTNASGSPAEWYAPSGSPKARYVLAIDTSSIHTKENVTPVYSAEALDVISRLSVKKFTRKRGNADTDLSYAMSQQNYQYGFIAEEVAETVPELAIKNLDKEGNDMAVSGEITIDNIFSSEHYKPANWKRDSVTALLVSAVQELTAKVAQLETQIANQ